MDWFKKHAYFVAVLSVLIAAILWMNSQLRELHDNIASIKVDMAIIETVLVIKGIIPQKMAKEEY